MPTIIRKSEILGFGIIALVVYLAGQALIQNVHITTSNGLWKSITLTDFMADPGWHRIIAANALLFPLHAAFGLVYDFFGIFEGVRWRQMAVTNAVFGALGAAVCFYFALRWTQDRLIAVFVAVAYCFAGFYVLHGLINEDIMPSAVLMLWAVLLAALWFHNPTFKQIFIVAILFNLGWLIEWRTMFPPLPGLCLALAISSGTYLRRAQRVGLFLICIPLFAFVFASLSWLDGYRTFYQALKYTEDLIWTGKGVGSGWSGFTSDKFWILWSGISESVYGARYFTNAKWMTSSLAPSTFIGLGLVAVMVVLGSIYAWRNRVNANVRNMFVIFFGLFASGAVFNTYSQPSDPQMQMNIMIVALPGWALVFGTLFYICSCLGSGKLMRTLTLTIAIFLAALPVSFSFFNFSKTAGRDASAQRYISEIETRFDISKTVFLYHDFDGFVTWWVAKHDGRTPKPDALEPAPSNNPAFKWIEYIRDTVENPTLNGKEHADIVIGHVAHVIDLGYQVLTPEDWNKDDQGWVNSLGSITTATKAKNIRHHLHSNLSAELVLESENGPSLYNIRVNNK